MNPVEKFLFENKNVIYSCKSISKKLFMHKKEVIYHAFSSQNLMLVKPYEVGCCKKRLLIFKYKD